MSDNRKYYYLKLKENFYNSETMVILESMQDGLLYSNLLLKMYLMSLKSGGILMLNDHLPHTPQTIATFTRHQVGTVERALKVFLEFGLVEILTDGAYYMTDIQLLIGQSSTEGERKKKERMRLKRQKLLPSGGADICPPYSQGDICPPEIRDKRLDIRDKSIISLIYSILFNRLCERADDVYGGRLPIHVRCLIDEAANIGQIPNLERLMATIRSREISACLVLQAQSQLKALYKDNMDTIIGNCDASLFLGGKEETTLKSWNSLLGKETIDLYNTSVTKGTQESHGQNFQKLGKDLMSMDEIAVMDGGKCLLQIRGVRPFLSRKYDITKHPNYKYLSDHNPKNAFDIEKFLSTRLSLRPGEPYRSYEISPEELTENTA